MTELSFLSRDRLEHLMKGLGIEIESVMDQVYEVMRNGGAPTQIIVGMPRVSLIGPSGRLDLVIKDDLPPFQVIIR